MGGTPPLASSILKGFGNPQTQRFLKMALHPPLYLGFCAHDIVRVYSDQSYLILINKSIKKQFKSYISF